MMLIAVVVVAVLCLSVIGPDRIRAPGRDNGIKSISRYLGILLTKG